MAAWMAADAHPAFARADFARRRSRGDGAALLKGVTKTTVARTRTTKKLAQRIDLNYFKRPSRYKRAKLWLSVLLPVLALSWIAWRSFTKDSRVYSSGRMSAAHAVLEKECATCHLQQASVFSAKIGRAHV